MELAIVVVIEQSVTLGCVRSVRSMRGNLSCGGTRCYTSCDVTRTGPGRE